MHIKVRIAAEFAALLFIVTLPRAVCAQTAHVQPRDTHPPARAAAYDATREVLVQGTVLSYSENSASRPVGAHVTMQTSTGPVDVHLGPSSYLRANHLSFAAGDNVRFVGAMSSNGKGGILLARIAQKGSQSVAIRSPQGFLLAPTAARALPAAQRSQATQTEIAR